jgi:hypothetical protein
MFLSYTVNICRVCITYTRVYVPICIYKLVKQLKGLHDDVLSWNNIIIIRTPARLYKFHFVRSSRPHCDVVLLQILAGAKYVNVPGTNAATILYIIILAMHRTVCSKHITRRCKGCNALL